MVIYWLLALNTNSYKEVVSNILAQRGLNGLVRRRRRMENLRISVVFVI